MADTDDPGSRALAYGQRAVDDPASRVVEDRVTGNGLALTRDDAGGEETAGGGGTAAKLPSPFPPKLDPKFTVVASPHLLREAVDVVSGNAHFKGMAFAVVDLTTSGQRNYAGSHDKEQRFIASTGKLAILFCAFQLRKAMREAAALITDKAIKKDTQLFDAILRQWRRAISRYFHGSKDSVDALPSLAEIFKATPRAAGGWDIDFANLPRAGTGKGFADRMLSAVLNSDDDDAGSCILNLGFPYIHGCMAESGIWSRGRGLWIALNYAGAWWWPETGREVGSAQAATAESLAKLLTLLELDELVPGSRAEMIDMLSGVRPNKEFRGVISYITVGITGWLNKSFEPSLDIRAKVGYTGDNSHCDAGIVQHDSKAGKLRYIVVLLNGPKADFTQDAARAIDVSMEVVHLPPPPP